MHSLAPKQDPSFHQTPFGPGNGSSLVMLSPVNQMLLLLPLFAPVTLKLLRSESLAESVTSKLLSGQLLFIQCKVESSATGVYLSCFLGAATEAG